MRTLLILDSSRFYPSLLEGPLLAAGWAITERGEDAEALLIDPSWQEDGGYSLLSALRGLAPGGPLPVIALLSAPSARSRSFLRELGIPWAQKGVEDEESLVARLEALAVPGEAVSDPDAAPFGKLLALALSELARPSLGEWLLPRLGLGLLGDLAGAKGAVEAMEVWSRGFCAHFPLSALGIRAGEARFLACLETAEARSLLPALSEALAFDGAPVPVEFPPLYPLTCPVPENPFLRRIRLELVEGELLVAMSTDDPAILGLLEGLVKDFDRALSVIMGGVRLEQAERRLFRVFSRFLPDLVINDLLRKGSDAALLTGEKRRIVALFSHVRDFARYVEDNDPSDLVRFLNRHFSLYSRIIRKHGGSINKYIGDAVFAIFGAPESHLDNARRALAAAIEIQEELARLPPLDIAYPPGGYHAGIGLHEGQAIVGNIGSRDSFDYTAIGDTINLAARLESLCKHYRTGILLSDDFRASVVAQGAASRLRQVDCARVKGRKEPTLFFTVVASAEASVEAGEGEAHPPGFDLAYRKGISMFRLGNWMTAAEFFAEAKALDPEDHLCGLYLERCAEFIARPPASWDGAMTLGFK